MSAKTTDADDEIEYRESQEVTLPEHTNYEDMTRAQIRAKIARTVGTRTNEDTPLDINTLNSAYAWFTGEFFIDRKKVGTPMSLGYEHIRWAVAHQAGMSEYPYPRHGTRPYRKQELVRLANALSARPDSRSWTGGSDDGE